MTITVSVGTLRDLYGAMLEDAPTQSCSSPHIMKAIADDGWALSWQLEDLISLADRRLYSYRHRINLDELGAALGIPKQSVCHRPRSISRGTSLFDAWAAVDFANMLISLEMLGFMVDPLPLVELLLPTIRKKGYISHSALEILWYERCRLKNSITLKAEGAGKLAEIRDHKLARGYKADVWIDVDGNPATITVRGPKHRVVKAPVAVKCACGLTWYRGDPESSLAHRKEHKRRMVYLDPQPHAQVLKERAVGLFDEHVDRMSPLWRNKEMYSRALAFKREEGYDFLQWSTRETDQNTHGFLFADDDGRIVGACAFRYRIYENALSRWGLQWVWIAQPHRRRGVLASRWATLRERFGDFDVETPVSDGMSAFLDKMGDSHLIENSVPKFTGSQHLF
ncbi:GNAT family N-acetyltransferase [Novosphingobium humi]|uniref:GNAT family N-acetyltransferase n=1 Tax=Novosphingobium humi TaxID=2282397 RepID=UPI0025AFEBDC|nr:GNAT family N-acetyltransferase [Novosphingobium humi]WJS98200.1 GNAT family N-acetyltransferase [Novosphingobium humi]